MDQPLMLLESWFAGLTETHVRLQLVIIVACALLAFGLVRVGKWRLAVNAAASDHQGPRQALAHAAGLADVLWPLLASLMLLLAARLSEADHRPEGLLRIGVLLLFASGAIRLVRYAVTQVFQPSGLLALLQRAMTLVAWLVVLLHATGLLSAVTDALASIGVYQLSGTSEEINLLQILQGAFWVALTLVIALWAGTALEARLMRMSTLDVSLQVALGRFGRALLVVVAVLLSMQLVGIPLGVLGVFGGALGVGLGLGLQRIASNYVSGFIILLDRSLRIGDLIAVDKYNGTVSQIRTRYTVVKALDGTEAILPNELLVSSPVLNHSYTSRQSRLSIKVHIAFDSDVGLAQQLLMEAARAQDRVLADPAPVALVSAFGADGLELELGFWIPDPELGTGQVRSDIHVAILQAFRQAGIQIPNPRREVTVEWLKGPGEDFK